MGCDHPSEAGQAAAALQSPLLGLEPGVEYAIDVVLDHAERTVDVPTELADAFATDPALGAAWAGWSYTRRREAAESITRAKKPETRDRRVAGVLDALRNQEGRYS